MHTVVGLLGTAQVDIPKGTYTKTFYSEIFNDRPHGTQRILANSEQPLVIMPVPKQELNFKDRFMVSVFLSRDYEQLRAQAEALLLNMLADYPVPPAVVVPFEWREVIAHRPLVQ